MGETVEVLKYKFDTGEAEAAVARFQNTLEQIKAKRAAGGDTSALEGELAREAAALGKLSPEQKKATSATQELLNSKRQLASVVGMLGGSFGGLIGQVSALFRIFSSGSVVVAGAAVALAGLSVLNSIFDSMAAAARRAEEAILRQVEAVKKLREEGTHERVDLVSKAAELGIGGRGAEMLATFQDVNARFGGKRPDLAQNAAVAQALSASRGEAFDLDTYLAGLATAGFKPIPLETGGEAAGRAGGPGAMVAALLRAIQKMQTAGEAPEAVEALKTFQYEMTGGLKVPRPAKAISAERTVDPLDALLARLAEERPDLTEKERTAVEWFLRQGSKLARDRRGQVEEGGDYGLMVEAMKKGILPNIGTTLGLPTTGVSTGEGGATVTDLLNEARRLRAEAESLPGSGEPRVPTTQPSSVNVQTINVGTVISHGEHPGLRMSMEPAVGFQPGS